MARLLPILGRGPRHGGPDAQRDRVGAARACRRGARACGKTDYAHHSARRDARAESRRVDPNGALPVRSSQRPVHRNDPRAEPPQRALRDQALSGHRRLHERHRLYDRQNGRRDTRRRARPRGRYTLLPARYRRSEKNDRQDDPIVSDSADAGRGALRSHRGTLRPPFFREAPKSPSESAVFRTRKNVSLHRTKPHAMKYLFLHYPACGTCRKAARWLAEHGVEAESRDIVLSNPGRDELSQWIATSGLPARKFFNTSGQRYKELNLKEKVAKASDGELIALLATEGKLVKRPLLVGPDFVLVGFREEQWQEKLLGR